MTEPTDAEIESAWTEATGSGILPYPDDMLAFARAVLAKWGQPQAVAGGEPVAWMWQHDETGRTGFVDRWQVENGWQVNNPRLKLVRPLVYGDTAPPPQAVREQHPIECTCSAADMPFGRCCKAQPMPDLTQLTERFAEQHHGITKGGQHGADN